MQLVLSETKKVVFVLFCGQFDKRDISKSRVEKGKSRNYLEA
jgi:hypothetical protein